MSFMARKGNIFTVVTVDMLLLVDFICEML